MRSVLYGAIFTGLVAAIGAGVAQTGRAELTMADAARALIATLDPSQISLLKWPFEADERFNWHFVPRERAGLPLAAMSARQREAAFDLLRAGLSEKGFGKAEGIRVLEGVLRELEGAHRDPDRYYFTIFGEPGATRWGWRYEGHHLSQNWTIVNGTATATTPAFIGANPAEVRQGPHKGLRVLAAEEDLARALLRALTPEQRSRAVLSATATMGRMADAPRRASLAARAGLPASALNPEQRQLLMRLIEEHAALQAPGLAEQRLATVRAEAPADLVFAWMGPTERAPGNGHYYRVQGRTFVIEYDNTQNDANHQHVVWRDVAGDFGEDLLARHYATAPHHAAPSASRDTGELRNDRVQR